ncbi:MAG: hypothetical protein IJS15_00935 [Victivallales bacterium]|nr:hypothetical protein [Victivallales bacterium]
MKRRSAELHGNRLCRPHFASPPHRAGVKRRQPRRTLAVGGAQPRSGKRNPWTAGHFGVEPR